MFYGILIGMYYDDHNPPHFHAFYTNNEATFDFNGKLISGKFPKKQLKLIEALQNIIKNIDKKMMLIYDINIKLLPKEKARRNKS